MSLRYQKFLLFGDSIIEFAFNSRLEDDKDKHFNFGASLVNAYTRKIDIVQRGLSGYNSRWALQVLPKILESERSEDIALSLVFFGTNDSAHHGAQQVELPEFKQNSTKIIQMLKEKGIKPILVGPALHDSEKWVARPTQNAAQRVKRSVENHNLYSDALQEIAATETVPFVNLFEAFTRVGGTEWRSLLSDGIHFSGKGYEVFYNELLTRIREAYPEMAPENIPNKFCDWVDVKADGSNIFV